MSDTGTDADRPLLEGSMSRSRLISRSQRRIGRSVGAAVAGILFSVVLVGCSQTDPGESSTSVKTPDSSAVGASPGGEAAGSPCSLLDDATLAALIGTAPQGAEVTVPGSDLRACQFGDITERGVQVTQVPAGEWAHALPAMVESMKDLPAGTLDASVMKQLEDASDAIAAGATIAAEEACTYFSRLLEIQGQEPGTTRAVTHYPDFESAIAITGQQCIEGTYTSLLVGRPDLTDDPEIVDQVSNVLDQLG
ncbi:UNVERIFIED_CONTAM: DUF3558 domain-containing protein [Microbacterium sp. SLM126]